MACGQRNHLFHHDVMPPVIAEIIHVSELVFGLGQDFIEGDLARVELPLGHVVFITEQHG